MKTNLVRFPYRTMAVVGLIFSCNTSFAQTENDSLPTALEVIANHVKAIGGKAKLLTIKTRTIKGKMSIPEQNISGTIKVRQAAPNLMLMESNIVGIGEQKTGSDGKTFWEISSMTGPEILEGPRAHQLKLESNINPFLVFDKMYDKLVCTGKEDFNGELCYVVKATKKDLDPAYSYFTVKTSLYAGNKMTVVTAMGAMEITTATSDYKKVDGVLMSHKTTAALPQNMTYVVEFTSVKINEKIDGSVFDVPSEFDE